MLEISRNTPWGWVYSYWERLTGGNPESYNENLCHFVRVVLFWTWWHAFFKQKILGTFVRPWMVLLVSLYIAGFLINPEVFFRVTFSLLLMLTAIVVCVWVIITITEKLKYFRPWTWFWTEELVPYVYPWTLALAAFVIWSYFYAPVVFSMLATVFLMILMCLVFLFIVVLLFIGAASVYEYLRKPSPGSSRSLSTRGVIWEYMKAKKKKICPYIKIREDKNEDEE